MVFLICILLLYCFMCVLFCELCSLEDEAAAGEVQQETNEREVCVLLLGLLLGVCGVTEHDQFI